MGKYDMPDALDWDSLEAQSPILADLPAVARRAVRAVKADQSRKLFIIGDRPAGMYFILSGEIRLSRTSATGQEIVMQRSRGGFLAEASLDQPRYHCDAVAVEASELLLIPRRAFEAALVDEAFRRNWISHLVRELRRVRAQAERLSLKTTGERIIHFIGTEGNSNSIVLTGSRKEWAAELGVTHEALYRAMSRMERDGDIAIEGASIRLRA
jgi:CRP-like cAMP-binding protein